MYLPILHLTNLKHLHIDDCRNLEKRCAEGSGIEWFQIAHVPNIRINGKYIQGKDSEDSNNFDGFDIDYEEFDVFDDWRWLVSVLISGLEVYSISYSLTPNLFM